MQANFTYRESPPARGIGLKVSRSHANVIYASLQQTPRGMRYIMPDRKLLLSPISASPMSGICQQAQIIILEILNVWMPVPLYLSGMVIIFAFPRSKSGIFDLILEKFTSFRSDTIYALRWFNGPSSVDTFTPFPPISKTSPT